MGKFSLDKLDEPFEGEKIIDQEALSIMARKEALSEIITAQKYDQNQGSEIPHWWNVYFENLPEGLQIWVMRAGPEPRTIAESVVKTLVADCYADNKDPNSRIEELDNVLLQEFRRKASKGTAASGS